MIILIVTGCEKNYDPDVSGNLVPKTVAEDPLLPVIEINGTRLHLEIFEDITNLIMIFLHGGPGSDYRSLISEYGKENASRYVEERTVQNGGLLRLTDQYFCVLLISGGAGGCFNLA